MDALQYTWETLMIGNAMIQWYINWQSKHMDEEEIQIKISYLNYWIAETRRNYMLKNKEFVLISIKNKNYYLKEYNIQR